jgi:predicted regulator of Ras-like GTPase activity (Roadblock/LC7/MglB family)
MQAAGLISILRELNASSPEIEGSWVISTEGLIIASVLPLGLDEDRGGALTAALLSRAERTARALSRGALEQFMLKGEMGCILMMCAGDGALLVVLTKSNAKVGLIFFDIEHSAKRVIVELKKMTDASQKTSLATV